MSRGNSTKVSDCGRRIEDFQAQRAEHEKMEGLCAQMSRACDRFWIERGEEPNEHGGMAGVMRRSVQLKTIKARAARRNEYAKDLAEAAALELERA